MGENNQSIIGRLLTSLRKLPSSKEASTKLLLALLGLSVILPIILKFGDISTTLPKLIVGPASALSLLLLILIGTWLRKVLDQRGRVEVRKKAIQILLQPVLKPHATLKGTYTLIRTSPIPTLIHKFPDPRETDGLLKEAATINCAAFRGSAFEDTFENKYSRNGSHQRRNPRAVMLMGFTGSHFRSRPSVVSGDQWVGFTHVLPVNESTYLKYINGTISDKDFSADLICPQNEPAHALILFSLGLDLYRLKRLYARTPPGWIDRSMDTFLFRIGVGPRPNQKLFRVQKLLWTVLVYHIREILDHQSFTMASVKLVAQSFNRKVIDILSAGGFTELKGRISCDRESLFELIIDTTIATNGGVPMRDVRSAEDV